MTTPPAKPCVYHITHVDNLAGIVANGGLGSDSTMVTQGHPVVSIGMGSIKQRRLGLPVTCHPGDYVGEYVPFYFCPRSIMLFVIHRANHPELAYRDGQTPIVHLEADLHAVVRWAAANQRRWAFSLSNAGAAYTEFRCDLRQLDEVDWTAVAATDFRSSAVKEGKQAEFLLHQAFPWGLVSRIGVHAQSVATRVRAAIQSAPHQPPISVQPSWYY